MIFRAQKICAPIKFYENWNVFNPKISVASKAIFGSIFVRISNSKIVSTPKDSFIAIDVLAVKN